MRSKWVWFQGVRVGHLRVDKPWKARATGEGVPGGRVNGCSIKIGHSRDWRGGVAAGGKEVGVETERGR